MADRIWWNRVRSTSVGDGQALLEAATKLKPDVIILDISMPVLNGIEAAVKLKEPVPHRGSFSSRFMLIRILLRPVSLQERWDMSSKNEWNVTSCQPFTRY